MIDSYRLADMAYFVHAGCREQVLLFMKPSYDYIPVQGLDHLSETLEMLYFKIKANPTLSSEDKYVLFQLGNQKSLLRITFAEEMPHFAYFDLFERPMTKNIKTVLINFLQKNAVLPKDFLTKSEEEQIEWLNATFIRDVSGEKAREKQREFLQGGSWKQDGASLQSFTVENAFNQLINISFVKPTLSISPADAGFHELGLFGKKENVLHSQNNTSKNKLKNIKG